MGFPSTLFDVPAKPLVETRAIKIPSVDAREQKPRPRPTPLAPSDDHPGAEARFDVLFTRDQMAALNATCAVLYEQWGVRVNKSQLLRALICVLHQARPGLVRAVSQAPPRSRLAKAPPKAASADVHRQFEAKLAAILVAGICARSSTR